MQIITYLIIGHIFQQTDISYFDIPVYTYIWNLAYIIFILYKLINFIVIVYKYINK